ncbi:MAG TPA: DNRLRE domain-containing protein [Anaerolineales bacterium]|jgi:chitodextrinase
MKSFRYVSIILAMLALMAIPSTSLTPDSVARAAGSVCNTSGPASGAYTVTLCFTSPADGAALVGYPTISATGTISVSGSTYRIQRMVFTLDGQYLLTDYQAPYIFTLPSPKWVDGAHTLGLYAILSDAYTSDSATLQVSFNNGITTPPVNTNQYIPTAGRPALGDEPFIVAAGGDGASGELNSVKVTDLIAANNPNLFLWLGDVMEKGSVAEFYNWYGTPTSNFGQFKAITNPTIGNHDYENGVAPGYFDYWDNIPNYYSYDANGWHFISLNSVSAYLGVMAGSPEYNWLAADLAANTAACTIVYYHHPYFNIGPQGPSTILVDIWNLMARNGVDIVLNGHDHNYQRWVALDGAGVPSPTGITEFVAGATGHGTTTFVTSDARVAYANDRNPEAYGAVFFQLNPAGANFLYRNTAGAILDSGVVPCSGAGADTSAPTAPANLLAASGGPTSVILSWNASRDNVGVSAYNLYRNGLLLASLASSAVSYTDLSAMPASTYAYTLQALDPAGNLSALSAPASATTSAMPGSLSFTPQADNYVNAASPTGKYNSTTLKVDADPDYHSYLRFNVQRLAGTPISKASLRLYALTNNSTGVRVHAVADNSWDESNTTYSNAPALGAVLATSGAFSAGNWVTLDITPYITGEGLFSLGLTSLSTTSNTFNSREAASNPPELVLELLPGGPDLQPPSVPAGLSAIINTATRADLNWSASSDNVGVSGYSLYRDGVLLATLASVTTYSDTTIQPGVTYQYAVDAFDAAGNHSARSAPVTAIPPDLTAPSVPTGLVAALLQRQAPRVDVDLSWNAASDNVGVSGYSVFRDDILLASTTGGTLYTDITAQPGLTYQYSLEAFDAAGNRSARSAPLAVTVIDTQAPSQPGGLIAAATDPSHVDLSWYAASDNIGVAGYRILRDGLPLATTGSLTYIDSTVNPGALYSYSLQAFDAAGNTSSPAGPVSVTVPSMPATLTFTPLADTYASAASPTSNYGKLTSLKLDASPVLQAYLRFNVQGLAGTPINRARLLVYASSSNKAGVRLYRLADNTWDELSLNYNNAPLFGALQAASPAITAGTWVALDVTSYVIGEGQYSFGVSTGTSTSSSLASRESGANAPQLVLDLDNTGPDTQAPTAPGALNATATGPTSVNLTWSASADNVGVSGYKLYRDASLIAMLPNLTTYTDASAMPASAYSYTLQAFDQAGNISAPSNPALVSTPAMPASLTFLPEADTYVNASKPASNYGTNTSLRVDASPDMHSYLRFNIQGLANTTMVKATLRLYSASISSNGILLSQVADNTWGELSTNFNNAPLVGSLLASSGKISAGTWISLDVTPYITGPGQFSMAITTLSSATLSLGSRNSGANAPQLILDLR